MTVKIHADASPEKRLFISLLTRDIPLIAAILDLLDNSINAAILPLSDRLTNADEYMEVLRDETVAPKVSIALSFSPTQVEITDTASGISSETASTHVFKFGRAGGPGHEDDRLSVYGIGLKRAMFKIGNKIAMRSDHVDGGFDLSLNVANWAKKKQDHWTFDITKRPAASQDGCGTRIAITELYDDVSRRLNDGIFEGQLVEAIAKTYSYFLAKFVNITVNDKLVEGVNIEIGENHSSEKFEFDDVTCAITAGIGIPQAGAFRDKSSGWFVFCNGRAVIAADKSSLTGWGGVGLPIFQPKHRPFIGTVFFVSKDPEQLPWTTTKSAINEDSALWQTAKRNMIAIGRIVVSFLDGRYTDDGTEVASKDLQEAAGTSKLTVLAAAVGERKSFTAPKRPRQETTKIQYDAKIEEVRAISTYLKRQSMSGSDVGRYTFNYFLRNQVGEK